MRSYCLRACCVPPTALLRAIGTAAFQSAIRPAGSRGRSRSTVIASDQRIRALLNPCSIPIRPPATKKTQKTPPAEIALAQKRMKEMMK